MNRLWGFAVLLLALDASAQSVVISEVMANPNEAHGGQRSGEYVELHNPSGDLVDLTGWFVADRDAKDALMPFDGDGPLFLEPGAYALLLDPDFKDEYALPAGVLRMKTPNSAIGNGLSSTDPVRLFDAEGKLVDSFTPPTSARSGISFERVDLRKADLPENWQLSTDPSGGTPGSPNSPPSSKKPPPPTQTGLVDSVVVNEVLYRPGPDAPEWIELYNRLDQPVTVHRWTVSDAREVPVSIPDGVLQAHGYGILTRSAEDFRAAHRLIPDGTLVLELAVPTLNDDGDTVTIRTGDGTQLDKMTYGNLDAEPGQSLERRVPDVESERMDNWLLSVSPTGSTPGAENSVRHDTGERALLDATPNPFDPNQGPTRIRYEAPLTAKVTLRIFNSAGVLIRVLKDSEPHGGRQTVDWDGKDDKGETVPVGIYVAQILTITSGKPRAAAVAVVVAEI